LAHYVERAVESGVVQDYSAAARALGITRARMTQLMNLSLLAPMVQEALLLTGVTRSERTVRSLIGEPDWERQRSAVRSAGP